MFCENARDMLLSTVVRLPDGSLRQNTRRLACQKWDCPQCKPYRQGQLARHLLTVADYNATLFVAVVPADRRRTIERAFKRRGGGGRLIVGLAGERHLHVSDVDCLTQQRVVKGKPIWQVLATSVQEAVAELRDPALPITRGGRWVGWARPAEEKGELLLAMDFRDAAEREQFAFRFGFAPDVHRGSREADPELVQRQIEAWSWWLVHERGTVADLGQSMLAPSY